MKYTIYRNDIILYPPMEYDEAIRLLDSLKDKFNANKAPIKNLDNGFKIYDMEYHIEVFKQ